MEFFALVTATAIPCIRSLTAPVRPWHSHVGVVTEDPILQQLHLRYTSRRLAPSRIVDRIGVADSVLFAHLVALHRCGLLMDAAVLGGLYYALIGRSGVRYMPLYRWAFHDRDLIGRSGDSLLIARALSAW